MSAHYHRLFLKATRPRTYPLALMSILVGQSLAHRTLGGFGVDNWLLCAFIIYTALSLQILSNLANDLGDGIRGTDHYRHKQSPKRLVGGGLVSAQVFKRWLVGWLIQTILAGSVMLSLSKLSMGQIAGFLGLGLLSIVGAISYTMGKKPYGYQALGELSVLIFFGFVAVMGGYYLQVGRADIVLNGIISTGVGLLCACVLYINNLRDVDTDQMSGKKTLAIVLGRHRICGYFGLLYGAMLCYGYHASVFGDKAWVLLGCLPLLIKHTYAVMIHRHDPVGVGKELGAVVRLVVVVNGLMMVCIL